MRDRVTISVDSMLKRAYEDLFGKEYTELLDEAMRRKMLESGRVEAYEAVIRIVDQEQEERRQTLARIRLNQAQMPAAKSNEEALMEMREARWQKDLKSFLNMEKTGGPNLRYIMREYCFDSESEARRWYIPRIRKELEKKA